MCLDPWSKASSVRCYPILAAVNTPIPRSSSTPAMAGSAVRTEDLAGLRHPAQCPRDSPSSSDVGVPLDHAAELAQRTGEGNAYWMGFGQVNVGL